MLWRGLYSGPTMISMKGWGLSPTRAEVPRTCLDPTMHMPLSSHVRGNIPIDAKPNRTKPRPADPETADRSTAWIWPAAPVTTEWRRRVGLDRPIIGQKACPWEALDIHVAEACTLVAFREHGRVEGDEASTESISRLRPCGRRLPQGNPCSQRLEAMSHLCDGRLAFGTIFICS
jgi:hypothetical protein